MKRKSILSLALMSFFAPSIFAEGVSSDEDALNDPTITSLSGKTITYTDSAGESQTFKLDSSITSDFSVSENTTATDWLGYQTIEKFLLVDGVYKSIYFDMNIKDFGDSSSYTESGLFTYYWDSEGKLTSSATSTSDGVTTDNTLAFTVYGNKVEDGDHIIETGTDGAGLSNADTGVSYSVNFIKNVASDQGGGIYNTGSITSITGEFIDNTASNQGGGIYNSGTITSITGDFILNSTTDTAGGAIFNSGTSSTKIGTIVGDFIANSASTFGGAINNSSSATIDLIIGDFIGNSVSAGNGGAIFNTNANTVIGTLMGNFIGNSASSAGGAIANTGSAVIYNITGDFIANTAGNSGGAIFNYNGATIDTIIGDFVDNCSDASGGAIFNNSTINSITGDFISNYAKNYGGAIYNNAGTISLNATSSSITFEGNYTDTGSNAIYNNAGSEKATSTINFIASGDNTIVVNDGIDGVADYKAYQILNINSGTVEFNNSVANNTVNVADGATLSLGSYAGELAKDSLASLNNVDMTVASGATLSIGTDSSKNSVEIINDSTIAFAEGSSILFEAYASLDVSDTSSTMTFNDLSAIIIDISNFEIGSHDYDLIYASSVDSASAIYNALINENITVQSSNDNVATGDVVLSLADNSTIITLSVVISSSAAVPEPSTYAMIFGVLALGFAAYRRRKQ